MSELGRPSTEDLMQVVLIELLRVYDVLFAMLRIQDPQVAAAILKKHEDFDIVGPLPFKEPEE